MGSRASTRLGLTALLAVTLFSFVEVFARGDYAGPALLGMLLAVGLVAVGRRFLLPTALILVVSVGALFWYLTVIFETRHLFYGFPTVDAARSLAAKISFVWEIGPGDRTPVPSRPGYVAATVAGMWIAAMLGELGTFRWEKPVVAAIPAIGLFSFATMVGGGSGTWFLMALFLTTLLTYWRLSSAHVLRSRGRWISAEESDAARPPSLAKGLARKMGAACVAAALMSPLVLHPADHGLLSWRIGGSGSGNGGEGVRGRVNPLVQIAPRLIQQSEAEFFRVTSDTPTYWHLATLGRFDGRRWHLVDRELATSAAGAIESEVPSPTPFDRVVNSINITGLRGDRLPAAAEPVTVLMGPEDRARQDDLRYSKVTGDLYLRGGLERGVTYQVETYAPSPSPEALMTATVGEVDPVYLQLPDEIPGAVRAIAERWTDGAESPYEKLVALQSRLRSFEYSTRVPPAASSDFLTEFLTETRTGYCQQFATAFALLARLHEIPTRVVVGFLRGERSPEVDNEFIVKGTHAHAWPEVFFEDIGWVAFEPTPRSVATPPAYSVPSALRVTDGGGPPTGSDDLNPFRAEQEQFRRGGDAPSLAPQQPVEGDDGAWATAFSRLARALGALVLAFLLLIPMVKALRFRLRYRRASTPVDLVAAAYTHLEAEANELASPRRPSESATRYVRRLVSAHRMPGIESSALATLYETAVFAPQGVDEDQAEEAARLARFLRQRLWSEATMWERTVRFFSPISLISSP